MRDRLQAQSILTAGAWVTGAEVMSLANSDENKTFGVVLRTPVENSKGIPHILEHSVLCGSRKYPIKVSRGMWLCLGLEVHCAAT